MKVNLQKINIEKLKKKNSDSQFVNKYKVLKDNYQPQKVPSMVTNNWTCQAIRKTLPSLMPCGSTIMLRQYLSSHSPLSNIQYPEGKEHLDAAKI